MTIARIRLVVSLSRPPVLALLALFAATGMAQAGDGNDARRLALVLFVVGSFVISAVALNDVADEAIDRVNLAGAGDRPLVAGTGGRTDLRIVAAAAALLAVAAASAIGAAAVLVVVSGLLLGICYSTGPVRLSARGAIASMSLPAGYVAVPYLTGLLAARGTVRAGDLPLLGGLYVGFIGRILLKDFRDVTGDALFGKRTFLVRHGRRRTCAVSAACWVVGSASLLGVRHPTPALVVAQLTWVVVALGLLRALGVDGGHRRDERLISAIAIVGRGMVLTLLAHLGMTAARWPAAGATAVLAGILLVHLGQARTMARCGPRCRVRVPQAWSASAQGAELPHHVHLVPVGAVLDDPVAGDLEVVGEAELELVPRRRDRALG